MKWFDNIHPNDRTITQFITKTSVRERERKRVLKIKWKKSLLQFYVLNLIYAQIDTEPISHCDGRFLFVGGYNTSAAARKCPTKIKTTVHRSRAQWSPSSSPPNRTNRCRGLFRVRQKRNKNVFFVNSQLVTTISFLSCMAVSLVACSIRFVLLIFS